MHCNVTLKGTLLREGYGDILEDNGGTFECSISWVQKFLQAMGLSWRAPTTAAQRMPSDWEQQLNFLAYRSVINLHQQCKAVMGACHTSVDGASWFVQGCYAGLHII